MSTPTPSFQEGRLLSTPIRDLGLKIAGTPLEPILKEFRKELESVGIKKLKPHFYLSTEWGVPFNTISLAIPFYLARPDLIEVHAERVGHVEGVGRPEILRYLRHEMGHVVNYAYKLYEHDEWIKQFGSITQPYVEEYRPQPFSRRYVRHLPGWYAQKHPDEDWAETFAVWMTPGKDWRATYANWATALAKVQYCDRTMKLLNEREPDVTATEADEDVSTLVESVEDFYKADDSDTEAPPPGLDGALLGIFEDYGEMADKTTTAPRQPAADLMRRIERQVMDNVYRWTGHFPERTRRLVRHLAERAKQLRQVYPEDRETEATIAVTTLVASLAMNYVFRGTYMP
jgi:hypothetical protein